MDQGAGLKNILMTARIAITVLQAFFLIDFHKNNIFPDLTDAFPGDTEFAVSSEKTAEFSGAWDDDGRNPSAAGIKFHIHRTAKGFTVAGIDDFFLFQINNSHKKPDFYTSFILIICFVVNCLDGKFTIIL